MYFVLGKRLKGHWCFSSVEQQKSFSHLKKYVIFFTFALHLQRQFSIYNGMELMKVTSGKLSSAFRESVA